MKALHALSLVDAAGRLARGELAAADYAGALLARVAATDAAIGAWACLDVGHVKRAAGALDARDAGGRGPLHGIPVGVKDIVDTFALPTRMGSPAFDDYEADADAECVARLCSAGGYVFGKTVTTELAFMHPGKTRNPWNERHTPGGSSQGSAAAVAASQVPGALGTQTNGSIIRPAAYCGVVGFKPTLGAIPFRGTSLFSETLDTLGTFTRSVADAAFLAAPLADGGIPSTPPALPRAPRIACLSAFPWVAVERSMSVALDAAVARLAESGAEVVAVALPDALEQTVKVQRAIMLGEAARNLAALRARADSLLSPTLRDALDEGARVDAGALAHALASRRAMIAVALDWLANFDALLVPSAPAGAPEGLQKTGDPSCCTLASLLGAPAITLPVGRDGSGLPLGAQLVAAPGADAQLLAVAAWCEARLPYAGIA
jgi:Asp-tRNA(Asn)/Glu-tRNA(Gln) amidotransferase A subunit family amidase